MRLRVCWLAVLLVGWLGAAGPAAAHPVAPALLRLAEAADGVVAVDWKRPPGRAGIVPRLEGCAPLVPPAKRRLDGEVVESWSVDCGAAGLAGAELVVDGLDESRGEVLVFATRASGAPARAVLRAGSASWRLPDDDGAGAVFGGYLALGFEHILAGLDHLLFVLGLILLVRGWKLLAWTVTGFTAGHSVTLALATLGWISLPQAPVEALIAVSILLLAVEITRDPADPKARGGVFRRRPWLVAGGFGLLHGLGFAGALAEVGLPSGEIPLALLAFNLGIELGQLAFVAAVLAAAALARPLLRRLPARAALLPPYAIGSLAAFWVFERLAALL